MPTRYEPFLWSMRPDERRRLDELAARRGVSRAAVLRAGLALVEGERPGAKRTGTRPADDRATRSGSPDPAGVR